MEIFDKVLSKHELKKKYSKSVRYLDDNYAFFLTHVLKMGSPNWSSAVPTAAVQIDVKDKNAALAGQEIDTDNFEFIFNPEFASKLNEEALAFVLAHETMHILLNHLKLAGEFVERDKVWKLQEKQEKGERLTKDEIKEILVQNQNAMRFNIAADCVINDYLASAGIPVLDWACRGKDWVGEDTAFLTVTEVYEQLAQQNNNQCPQCNGSGEVDENGQPQDKSKGNEKGDGSGDQSEDGSGEGEESDGEGEPQDHSHGDKGQPCPTCSGSGKGSGGMGQMKADGTMGDYQAVDDHGWMLDPDYAEKVAEAIDKMNDEMEKQQGLPQDLQDKKVEEDGGQTQASKNLNKSMQAGSEDGNMTAFQEQHGVEMAFVKLLREVDPDLFKEPGIGPPMVPSFHERRRKLGAPQFKNLALPVYRKEEREEKKSKEKPSIVLALDVSGSIGPKDAQRFITLGKSIPTERVKIFACTFEYNYKAIDLQNDTNFSIGGGTNFDSIPQFINDHVKPELKGAYPKAVIIITDGAAGLSQNLWPSEAEAKSWFWLISPTDYGYSYPASMQIGRRAMLDEFIA